MKKAVVVLAVVAGLLAVLLWKTRSRAQEEGEQQVKVIQTLSNKVTEVETRMVMNQALGNDKLSTVQTNLELRLRDLARLSNHVAQARKALTAEQEARSTALSEAQASRTRLAEVEAEVADLKARLEPMAAVQAQVGTLNSNLASLRAERDALSQDLARARLSEAQLQLKLQDVASLRIQVAKLEDEARLARELAAAGPDPRLIRQSRLELMPDGSVKLVPPANIPTKPSSPPKNLK
jgi:chromosome segregation ATPase